MKQGLRHVFLGVLLLLLSGLSGPTARAADEPESVSIENDVLRISLNRNNASLTVTDKRIGLDWRQNAIPRFRVAASSIKQPARSISTEIAGEGGPYTLALSLNADCPHAFDVAAGTAFGIPSAAMFFPGLAGGKAVSVGRELPRKLSFRLMMIQTILDDKERRQPPPKREFTT